MDVQHHFCRVKRAQITNVGEVTVVFEVDGETHAYMAGEIGPRNWVEFANACAEKAIDDR